MPGFCFIGVPQPLLHLLLEVKLPEAALHLEGRGLREGDDEDVLRAHAAPDQLQDAVCDHRRLPGAWSGQHHRRPVSVFDCPFLIDRKTHGSILPWVSEISYSRQNDHILYGYMWI